LEKKIAELICFIFANLSKESSDEKLLTCRISPPLYYQKDDLGFKKETKKTRGVSHSGLAIYIEKYLNAKEELWKFKYIVTMQKYNLFKKKTL
jgi:hypothetical protein